MAQQPIELILMRHLASRLAVPVFIVDAAGDMVYFNEPAERVLGRRFNEVREMPFDQWTTAFLPQGESA
ncbi:MAG TPA: PAS domain-containing protein, partial [Candidatus Limnocylindria bacterium]|nr:PAS domain-containing protein [Candidatus Limnocylindria bacterium]